MYKCFKNNVANDCKNKKTGYPSNGKDVIFCMKNDSYGNIIIITEIGTEQYYSICEKTIVAGTIH